MSRNMFRRAQLCGQHAGAIIGTFLELYIERNQVPLQGILLTVDKVRKDMSKYTPALTVTGLEALMMATGSRLLNSGVWLYQSVL
jgi:hypothetical protein